jgi:hypothetical protein
MSDTPAQLEAKSNKWIAIFTVIGVGIALWGAAIRPLEQESARTAAIADKQAEAVLLQNDKIYELQKDVVRIQTALLDSQKTVDDVKTNGYPPMDKRLTIIEYELQELQNEKKS